MKGYIELNFSILYWMFVAPFRGSMYSIPETFRQIVRIGVQAIPMASLTALSIGLTLAMQSAQELIKLGAEGFVPDLVFVALLRELGPLLIAVIIIGRSGSAVAAELGTMKVSEEIEALQVMAINPVRHLVVPRVLAMLLMLPVLVVFGNCVGTFGGWLICHFSLNMDTATFIIRCVDRASTWDLYCGLIKSVVFAWIIISISCYAGMSVTGGAEGVGKNTTSSVVLSLISVLIANAILTTIFFIIL